MPDKKKKDQKKEKRQIIIETDGNNIELKKVEVSGMIELRGILRTLLENLNNK